MTHSPTDIQIGKNIRKFMIDYDLSTLGLAELWDMTPQHTRRVLHGDYQVRLDHLRTLAEKFDVDIRVFFE